MVHKVMGGDLSDWLLVVIPISQKCYLAPLAVGCSGPPAALSLLAFVSYILLGKLASQPAQHDQLVTLYRWLRFFSGILAINAGYDFISLFIKDEKWKLWAITILVLGGGGGWILVSLEQKI